MDVYIGELSPHHKLFVVNANQQTQITQQTNTPSQQQSQSTHFDTGTWKVLPRLFQLGMMYILYVSAEKGDFYVRIQGGSMQLDTVPINLAQGEEIALTLTKTPPPSMEFKPFPPLKPMEPMKPFAPLGTSGQWQGQSQGASSLPNPKGEATEGRNFCSQCGKGVKVEDKFCSHCGHRLM